MPGGTSTCPLSGACVMHFTTTLMFAALSLASSRDASGLPINTCGPKKPNWVSHFQSDSLAGWRLLMLQLPVLWRLLMLQLPVLWLPDWWAPQPGLLVLQLLVLVPQRRLLVLQLLVLQLLVLVPWRRLLVLQLLVLVLQLLALGP